MELLCKVQHYDWGKTGLQSEVAAIYKNMNDDITIDESLPYAELWMGTHENAPSVIKETGAKLSSIISTYPELLGEEVLTKFGNDLPFLFKVLSVNKALSIQAHPSKEHAVQLHTKFPNIYKDPNHKPELAIALTKFEALVGFRPIFVIRDFVTSVPELKEIIGDVAKISDDIEFLKKAFKTVLTCDVNVMKNKIDQLLQRLQQLDEVSKKIALGDLVERLHYQFPYDNGILMIYFLNYLQLEPSQAIYLGANEPHAYLSGDCIECMACSDNVVRAGLTPKFIDVETLCSMLVYKGEDPESKLFDPIQEDEFSRIYKPPVPDFAVVQISVPPSQATYQTSRRSSASILLVVSGSATYDKGIVVRGTILFIPSKEILTIKDIKDDLVMYQAVANI